MTTSIQDNAPLLEAMMNLTQFHREHEKFYASSPRWFARHLAAPRPHPPGACRSVVNHRCIHTSGAESLRGGR